MKSARGEVKNTIHSRGKGEKKKKKSEKWIVRMLPQISNLETLGGRERSLRGLYVSERASEGDHRHVAGTVTGACMQGQGHVCDFTSLLLSVSEGTRPARPQPPLCNDHGGGSLLHVLISECDTCGYACTHKRTHARRQSFVAVVLFNTACSHPPRGWVLPCRCVQFQYLKLWFEWKPLVRPVDYLY